MTTATIDKPTHTYRWRKYMPDWFGRTCVVEATGSKNSVKVRFTDGIDPERAIVSRYAVRRIK